MSDDYIRKINAWGTFDKALRRLNAHIDSHDALKTQLGAEHERLALQSDWDAVYAAADMIKSGYDGLCSIDLVWSGTEYVYLFHRLGDRLGVM